MFSRSSTLILTIAGFLVISCATADDLSYIKACSISDPEINKCLVNSANEAWDAIKDGKTNLPAPAFLPYWDITGVSGGQLAEDFYYIQNNTKLHDFETMKFVDAVYDKDENSMLFITLFPIMRFTSDYEMDVKFIDQHIYGKGDMICTLDKVQYYIKIFLKDNGDKYAIETTSFNISAQKVVVEFKNLFNGDVQKGEEANKLINENRKAFFSNVAKGWSNYANKVIRDIVEALATMLPKDNFLKP